MPVLYYSVWVSPFFSLFFSKFLKTLAVMPHSLTFAPRSRAAVARRAHNPKVRGSIPLFATTK